MKKRSDRRRDKRLAQARFMRQESLERRTALLAKRQKLVDGRRKPIAGEGKESFWFGLERLAAALSGPLGKLLYDNLTLPKKTR